MHLLVRIFNMPVINICNKWVCLIMKWAWLIMIRKSNVYLQYLNFAVDKYMQNRINAIILWYSFWSVYIYYVLTLKQ